MLQNFLSTFITGVEAFPCLPSVALRVSKYHSLYLHVLIKEQDLRLTLSWGGVAVSQNNMHFSLHQYSLFHNEIRHVKLYPS